MSTLTRDQLTVQLYGGEDYRIYAGTRLVATVYNIADLEWFLDRDPTQLDTLRQEVEGLKSGHHVACESAGYYDSDGVPHPPICHPDCWLQKLEIADAHVLQLTQQLATVTAERDALLSESLLIRPAADMTQEERDRLAPMLCGMTSNEARDIKFQHERTKQQLATAKQELARCRDAMDNLIRESRAVADDHHKPRYTRLDEAIESAQQAREGTG